MSLSHASQAMKNRRIVCFLLIICAALAATHAPVAAQGTPPPGAPAAPPKVYTNVEQMPQLPTGGGSKAVIEAIRQRVLLASPAIASSAKGRVVVVFNISASGVLRDGYIDTGLGTGPDEAVLAALSRLPRFLPGRQNLQRVAVRLTLPITFPIVAPPQPAAR